MLAAITRMVPLRKGNEVGAVLSLVGYEAQVLQNVAIRVPGTGTVRVRLQYGKQYRVQFGIRVRHRYAMDGISMGWVLLCWI